MSSMLYIQSGIDFCENSSKIVAHVNYCYKQLLLRLPTEQKEIAMIQPPVREAIDKFWDFFPPVWYTVRAHIHYEAAENFEITVGQFHILRRIRNGIDAVSKLADDRHTTRPAISRTVDVLVQKGLVNRSPNPNDRRFLQLSLTAEGRALMDGLFTNTRQWMAAKMADLKDDEIEAILMAGDALKRAFTEKTVDG